MQTHFTARQLADPATASSESIIRKCVHCGFCLAACPTYVLLGDELDSPRGRIYLIKDMLENDRAPDAELAKHIDRCLSCLSCKTTCPSGVDYMHLIDHARVHIHNNYNRPWHERFYRRLISLLLPYPKRFRVALALALLARPFAPFFGKGKLLKPLGAMLALAPRAVPAPVPVVAEPLRQARGRVILLQGCVEPVLRPHYRAAAVRLLRRMGFEVVFAAGEGCCGALVHHMGQEADALAAARRNIDAWTAEIGKGDVKAIITTASGCGTVIKDYGFMLRGDTAYAEKAAACSALTKDIAEFLAGEKLPGTGSDMKQCRGLTVAYHAACSLQHGQNLGDVPKALLEKAGFDVRVPAEAHLCCGSAGTYNILQPEISAKLAERKAANFKVLNADVIATGNVGCALQIGNAVDLPVVHVVELIDWATGGPRPSHFPQLNARSSS